MTGRGDGGGALPSSSPWLRRAAASRTRAVVRFVKGKLGLPSREASGWRQEGASHPSDRRRGRLPAGGVAHRLAAFALSLALAAPALGQPSPQDLREAERVAAERARAAEEAARRAAEVAAEEERLAERRVEAARRAQEAEAEVGAAMERLAELQALRAEAEAAIVRRAEALRPFLPVMMRLSVWPTETLLAVPAPPEEALRGTLVLRGLARHLTEEAAALRDAQEKAVELARAASAEAERLAAARGAAQAVAAALDAELEEMRARRTALAAEEEQAAERAQAAAARAANLQEVLARLERERARREAEERAAAAAQARREAAAAAAARRATRDESRQTATAATRTPAPPRTSRGRTVPVAGRVITNWGEATPGGPHRGLTYSAPAGARVVSPCAGRAVFAAPFRSYGLLLIVDCGGGYHFVLAGMDRLDASVGQRLLAGEPVGVLGSGGSEGGGRATLYVELRRNGQPTDPRRWFTARG